MEEGRKKEPLTKCPMKHQKILAIGLKNYSVPAHVGASQTLFPRRTTVRSGRGLSASNEPRLGDWQHEASMRQHAPAGPVLHEERHPYLHAVQNEGFRFPWFGIGAQHFVSSRWLVVPAAPLFFLSAGARTICSAFSCCGCGACLGEDFSLVNGLTSLASSPRPHRNVLEYVHGLMCRGKVFAAFRHDLMSWRQRRLIIHCLRVQREGAASRDSCSHPIH